MKTPENVYLVMYPSEDPLNEPLESLRVNKVFLNHPTAQVYIYDLLKMIPDIVFDEGYSEKLPRNTKGLARMSMKFEVTAPFETTYKYVIVKMKLHGKLSILHARNRPFLNVHTLHLLDFDPKSQRPKTEYDSIHSVHASLDVDTFDEITGGQKLDWRRPFGHETDHMYAPFVDQDGVTKYLVTSSHRLL